MMSEQLQINDYYGYNSIVDCEGKRIRRMRRTEASAQKLLLQRVKSPYRSRDPSSQRSRASPIQRSNLSGSLNTQNSGLKFRREKIPKTNIQKQSQSYHSVSNFDSQKSKGINGLQSSPALKRFGGVKEAIGQYYIGNQSNIVSKTTKQQLRSYRSNQKGSKYYEVKQQTRNYQGYTNLNEESRRTLKKTERNYQVRPFQLYQNIQKFKKSEQKRLPEASLIKKRQSNIQSNLSRSNNKKNDVSSVSKNNNNKMSQSLKSSSELQVKSSKLSKRNKVNFEQSLMKSADLKNNYNIDASQKESLSKKSSVNIQLDNQKSNVSQGSSNFQSYASSLKSKIKQNKEKSKISKINQFHEQQEIKASTPKVKAGIMTKKSTTQTTESDQNIKTNQIPQTSRKIKRLSNPNKKSIAISHQKLSKPDYKPDFLIENQESSSQSQSSNNKNQVQVNNQKIQPKNAKFSLGLSNQKHAQVQQNMKINKKKSLGNYTFNDVVQNIQEHDIRICSLYLFVDSTKSLYETPLKFQRYERLCFLMLKKYKYQKDRIVESLEGGQSCFNLTDAEIPTQVIKKHINRMEVRQRLAAFIDEVWKISQELQQFYSNINKKYQKDKYIKLDASKDNFSPQIMRLLMEQMSKLYLQLQKEDIQNDVIDNNEQRIIQIVQIMFLISQLSGRFVKKFQLFQENQIDFQEYYSQNYEKIMETAEYFEKYA